MIKQGLELKQTQKMSPLQILTIKLLELPIQSLEQKIRSELEENPVLDDSPDPNRSEESKDISIDELKDDDYIPSYKTRVNNWGKDPRPEYNSFSVKTSFNQRRKTLRNSLKPLVREMAAKQGLTEEQIQTFLSDPVFDQRPERLGVEDFVSLTNRF